jgi:putative hydrolase of the HAD superfamily
MLEAILFDWGSTLAGFEWSPALLAEGHRAGLAALGREGESAELTARFEREKLPALRALGAEARLDYLAELRDLLGPVADDELDRFLNAEHDAWRPARTLAPGALELLESLHGDGLRLGLVANNWPDPARLVRAELAEHGVDGLFDAIALSGEVGVRKPDPAIFQHALGELGIAPAAALFVGDRLIDDIRGAAAVGMTTVQATWCHTDEAEGADAPDFVASSPREVLAIVQRLAH